MNSEYTGVTRNTGQDFMRKPWMASGENNGLRWHSTHKKEREAAKAYDVKMISMGMEPVNILKRK